MGITVTWDNESDKHTIRFDIADYWTWEDFKQALDTAGKLREGIPNSVNLIINLLPRFRARIATPEQTKDIMNTYAAGLRLLVIISDDLFVIKAMDTFYAAYPAFRRRTQITPTLEAAREYISRSYQPLKT